MAVRNFPVLLLQAEASSVRRERTLKTRVRILRIAVLKFYL